MNLKLTAGFATCGGVLGFPLTPLLRDFSQTPHNPANPVVTLTIFWA